MADLRFRGPYTAPAGNAVELNFSAGDDRQSTTCSVHVTSAAPTLSGIITARRPPSVAVAAQLQKRAPVLAVSLTYDNRVWRTKGTAPTDTWRVGTAQRSGVSERWQVGTPSRRTMVSAWHRGVGLASNHADGFQANAPRPAVVSDAWSETMQRPADTTSAYQVMASRRLSARTGWQEARAVLQTLLDRTDALQPAKLAKAVTWGKGAALAVLLVSRAGAGQARTTLWRMPWERARIAPPGREQASEAPVTPPYRASADLYLGRLFRPLDPAAVPISFGRRAAVRQVPVLRVYIVTNELDFVRLPGREQLHPLSVNVALDYKSWAWKVSATLPYAMLPLVDTAQLGPVEAELTINGVKWAVLLKNYSERRAFGGSTLQVEGISRATYLAAPYARTRSLAIEAPATAQQIARAELQRVDLDTGYDLDWKLADWLVPANSWSYQDLAPIGVISRIAEAAGGYVNAHPYENRLIVQPEYPEPPWNWGALQLDADLPVDLVKVIDHRFEETPAFNGVYVQGDRNGILARVFRSGTAGDQLAPTVVDELITHVDAARSRGTAILGNTGKHSRITLEMPMLPEVGLLAPGAVVQLRDTAYWRGIVRATDVSARWGRDHALTVAQTVEIERRYR
ncbi:hypothetical protein ABNQ24_12620 [Ralstonia pseudosolanacearum]|uniref:hypothetical protein n=1 Tax=Ralstonia pseudosolanacearum TaxID=1310165 RepID=UPI003369FC74